MIEHIPERVDRALLYLHSARASSAQLRPFLPLLIEGLPNTYIWAGDGVIGGAPQMRQGLRYGGDGPRFWFTFPMQDAATPESFAVNVEAMGATLACCGAYVNAMADQVMARFGIPAQRVVLAGFQHGSCAALAAAMVRFGDPYAVTVLFEPYALETYYLKDELALPPTTVYCIENEHIRARTRNWIGIETDVVLGSYGIATQQITVPGGGDALDEAMVCAATGVVGAL